MPFLLDTNILIRLRDGEPEIARNVGALDGAILMSIISRVELEGGVYREPSTSHLRRPRLDAILAAIPTVVFDAECADAYGRILTVTGYSRRKLLDRMIASQAIVHRATLVTGNSGDFSDIPGLAQLRW